MKLLREFKPALMFLGKFLALYFVGNILYGLYVESYDPQPDAVTRLVTAQTSWLLDLAGYETSFHDVPGESNIAFKESQDVVLYVYEGCNGINVMIVFIAFLFAFGGSLRKMALFLPLGVLIIHLFNLLRITFLFYLALHHSNQFYFYHKYLFTATLYAVVLGLWALWVIRFNERKEISTTT